MKRHIVWHGALVFALVSLALSSSAWAQSAVVEQTDAAQQLIAEGQFERALADLDGIIADEGAYAPAHYLRGIALGNLGRESEALAAFVLASELNPGWGAAHRLAAIAAINTRNLPVAWEQAVKAYQAGEDVSASFNQLLAMERAPADLDAQLAAARIFVMPLNTEKLAAEQDNPWGVDVLAGGGAAGAATAAVTGGGTAGGGGGGGGGSIVNPFNTSATRATNPGGEKISRSQSSFFNLLQQTRRSLANSRSFGVVAQQEMAQYLLAIEVDTLDAGKMRGYLKLYDPRSGEEEYRRVVELRNINSLADLNADLERIVGYMEKWLSNRAG